MRKVSIVVLAKYPEIFEGFRKTIQWDVPKVLVRDGNSIPDPGEGWTVLQGPPTFSMAGNANLGWKAVDPDSDILYIGDDVRPVGDNFAQRLQAEAYSDPTIGILSPHIQGPACNPLQTKPPLGVTHTYRTLAFVCIYIKRELISKIGYMDERFNQYGFDDDDYCRRTMLAGYTLAVTSNVDAIHEHGTSTFKKNKVDVEAQTNAAREKYFAKWHDMSNVTALIKTFIRDELLYDCVASLKQMYPNIHIHVADDGRHSPVKDIKLKTLGVEKYYKMEYNQGTTKGRNLLIDGCETPYFLLGDDDFTYTPETDLTQLLRMMDVVDLAGGACRYRGGINHFEADYVQRDGKWSWNMGVEHPIAEYLGVEYAKYDLVFNFFIAKTEYARRVRWDEKIHCACEHDDFFMSWHKAKRSVVYCPNVIVSHKLRQLPDSMEYSHNRHKNADESYFAKKWNWVWPTEYWPAKDAKEPPAPPSNPIVRRQVGMPGTHIDARTGRAYQIRPIKTPRVFGIIKKHKP